MESDLRPILLAEIEPTPAHIEEGRILSLESLGHLGIVQVVQVQDKKHRYEVVDGWRTVAHLRTTEERAVLARVHDNDPVLRAKVTLAANLHRAPNPAAEARACLQLEQHGYAVDEICRETGLPKKTIANRLSLIKGLDPALFAKLEQAQISLRAAMRATRLSVERQRILGAREGIVSTKHVKEQLREYQNSMLNLESLPRPEHHLPISVSEAIEQMAQKQRGANRKILLSAVDIVRQIEREAA